MWRKYGNGMCDVVVPGSDAAHRLCCVSCTGITKQTGSTKTMTEAWTFFYFYHHLIPSGKTHDCFSNTNNITTHVNLIHTAYTIYINIDWEFKMRFQCLIIKS